MSAPIKNLHFDQRDVGKTISSTKKYYMWEFTLNGKYHKIEIYNSKLSGKKKLALDAQVLIEDKTYKNNFTYSFKIDKTYFSLSQISSDKFELKIDNKSFEMVMLEEKTTKLNQNNDKIVKKPHKHHEKRHTAEREDEFQSTQNVFSSTTSNNANKKNSKINFYNEDDFDFTGENGNNNFPNVSNKINNTFEKSEPFVRKNTSEQPNAGFGFKVTQSNKNIPQVNKPAANPNLLIDVTDILEMPSKPIKQQNNDHNMNNDLNMLQQQNLHQINFGVDEHANQMIYLQNRNLISNIKIFEDGESSNDENSYTNRSESRSSNLGNQSGFNLMNDAGLPTFNKSTNSPIQNQRQSLGNQQLGNTTNWNNNQGAYSPHFDHRNSMPTQFAYNNIPFQNDKQATSPYLNRPGDLNNINVSPNLNNREGMNNPLKKNIEESGLVDFNNILEEKKKNPQQQKNVGAEYNFSFGNSVPLNQMQNKTNQNYPNYYENNNQIQNSQYGMGDNNMRKSFHNPNMNNAPITGNLNQNMSYNNQNMGYNNPNMNYNQNFNYNQNMNYNQSQNYNDLKYNNPIGTAQNVGNNTNDQQNLKRRQSTPFDY